MVLRALLALLAVGMASTAHADPDRTREALNRFEEVLELRQKDGQFDPSTVLPLLVVRTQPRYERSAAWFPTEALSTIIRVFGSPGIRVCEACMAIRTHVAQGVMHQSSGVISLDEVIALDARYRGEAAPARTAIWMDETAAGVSIRLVDLRSARLIFAQNIDPDLQAYRGSARSMKKAAEMERRTRGDSLTHAIFDLAIYPGQHISLEWADQFGEDNANLAGIVLSFIDPVAGIGVGWYRALEWGNLLVGGKLMLSLPTVLAEAQLGEDTEIIDPALTAVGVVRIPFGDSNYAGTLTFSTNGVLAAGLSFLNSSLLPILP